MPGAKSQSLSQSLNTRSSLAMLLRTLYRIGLDYCILPPAEDFPEAVIFTKDQLVSLVERTGPETLISDIAKQVTQGALKPVAVIKSDIKPDESPGFISKAGLPDPEQLQVLRVDDDGSEVMCLHEALHPKGPDFPEWWEAPVPFAMYGMGKLHINRTAELMFGSDLKRLSDTDIPDKNEFLVALENSLSPCSVTFRRLEGDIFMLDDSTGDVMAAADIAWWAAIGRAWLAKLDREKCRYRRYEQINEAKLEGLRENNVVLPCEWEGELLGYLCVEKSGAKTQPQTKPKAKAAENSKERAAAAKQPVNEERKNGSGLTEKAERTKKTEQPAEKESAEDETLKAVGPQALGLLVPGSRFADTQAAPASAGSETNGADTEDLRNASLTSPKTPQTAKTPRMSKTPPKSKRKTDSDA